VRRWWSTLSGEGKIAAAGLLVAALAAVPSYLALRQARSDPEGPTITSQALSPASTSGASPSTSLASETTTSDSQLGEPGCPSALAVQADTPVRHCGHVELHNNFGVDLDSTAPNWDVESGNAVSGQDINYSSFSARLFIHEFAVVDTGPTAFSTCDAVTNYQRDAYLDDMEAGSRMCLRTGEGRRALLRFSRLPKANLDSRERSTAVVAFDVVTWDVK
jgi:hypothetical protein